MTEKKVLKGEDAIALWRKGKDAWNTEIQRERYDTIDFSGADFSKLRKDEAKVSFEGFEFGDAKILFCKVNFGDRPVVFQGTRFGTGRIPFYPKSKRDNRTRIYRERRDYHYVVDFTDAIFGGRAIFTGRAEFDESPTSGGTRFFLDSLRFVRTQFNGGLSLALWRGFRGTDLKFDEVMFASSSRIDIEERPTDLEHFDFRGSDFQGYTSVAGELNLVPDLRNTINVSQLNLSKLSVKLQRKWRQSLPQRYRKPSNWKQKTERFLKRWAPRFSQSALSEDDADRLRRLKDIAEINKDHQAALRFAADEHRARRWIHTPWFASVLDLLFSSFSNYGQTVWRPSFCLFLTAPLFAFVYTGLVPNNVREVLAPQQFAEHVAALSLSNTVPFLSPMVTTRRTTLEVLFPCDPGFLMHAAMAVQSLLSLVFVFLIGLGLRNRFRL